jgi:hypothetical protein
MRILTGLLVLALAVTGCGSDDPEPQGATYGDKAEGVKVDACKLLTPADLEAAFGSPFGDGELSHKESGADQCAWTSTDAAQAKTFSIAVLREDGLDETHKSAGQSLADVFKQTKAAYPNAEPVNLGDEAYAAVSEVQVLDADTWYSFTAYLGAGIDPLGGLKKLATQVVG